MTSTYALQVYTDADTYDPILTFKSDTPFPAMHQGELFRGSAPGFPKLEGVLRIDIVEYIIQVIEERVYHNTLIRGSLMEDTSELRRKLHVGARLGS